MKTYHDISGWFNFEPFYDKMVAEAQEQAVFVEIGCWLGKSTSYLCSRILGSGKHIKLHVYDLFGGSENEPELIKAAKASDIEVDFVRNLRSCGINVRKAGDGQSSPFVYDRVDSVRAAGRHSEKSVDMVFLDGSHTFDAVTRDIAAWRSKVKPGGVLAGHDYFTYESVRNAVHQSIGQPVVEQCNVWWVRL